MRVEVVNDAAFGVGPRLPQRTHRMAGVMRIGDVGVPLRIVLSLRDVAELDGDIVRELIGGDGFVGREHAGNMIDHDVVGVDVDRVVNVGIGNVVGSDAARAIAGGDQYIAKHGVVAIHLERAAGEIDSAGRGLAGDGDVGTDADS